MPRGDGVRRLLQRADRAAPRGRRRGPVERAHAAEEEGDRLSHEELIANLILLLIAGHETTSNLLGNGRSRSPHPRPAGRLRDDPSLVRTAVDEFLRYDPPVQFTARNALVDVDIAGEVSRRGSSP